MVEKVFIIGATGKVGRALVSQIFDKGDTDPARHKNPTVIVGLASSSGFLYSDKGLSKEIATAFISRKIEGEKYVGYLELFRLLRNAKGVIKVVDATASKDILSLHLKIISESNHCVVTANKNPLSLCDFGTFRVLTSETQKYGFRCSVMAGAEAVDKIRDLKDLGDLPLEITGSFSGTLGFITSELDHRRSFSATVSKAMDLGYTEPHPASDLDGSDVAKKILILGRIAGYAINLSDIAVTPFIPDEYLREGDVAKFISAIKKLDASFDNMVCSVNKEGKRLRYIASLALGNGGPEIKVGLQTVDADSPIGVLSGTLNKIVIKTETYGDKYYSIEAPGAGIDLTAQNIRRDLLYQISRRRLVS